MNKRITLSLGFLTLLVSAAVVWNVQKDNSSYQPRVKQANSPEGQMTYFLAMRNNAETGMLSQEDVQAVRAQMKAQRNDRYKAEFPVKWEFAGPDNYGGRTRAIVVDQTDANILYAGGVSGTVFRSDNKGGTWRPLSMDGDGFAVTAMAQTADGALFAGTGENWLPLGSGTESSSYKGSGIYKSTDSANFELLTSTKNFGWVAAMTVDASGNTLFAATQSGLRVSSDGGNNWTTVRTGACKDIKISKNNVALAYVGSALFRSTSPSTAGSYSTVSGVIGPSNMKVAWSESDPNYAYVVTAGPVDFDGNGTTDVGSGLTGLFKSTDAGQSFTEVVNQGTTYFSPASQGSYSIGWYALCIGVHPRDRDRVFIGSLSFAEWTLEKGPKIVGSTSNGPTNPFGIHSDKHTIVFDNSGDDVIMYIGSDGGISATTNEELTRYQDRVINYTTTQNYHIAANPSGQFIGSTQDQGNILVSTESYPRKPGHDIFEFVRGIASADGFGCEMSQYNQEVMFIMAQQAGLARTLDAGQNADIFWDNRVAVPNPSGVMQNSGFPTGLHLWENPDAVEGKLLNGPSQALDDIYEARLFLMLDDGIWMANNATASPHNPENPSNETVRWFKIGNTSGHVMDFETTRDGNSLFAGTNSGRLYRVDGLNKANWDTTELVAANAISDSLTITNITGNMNINGRYITGIASDVTDPNRLMITVGHYGGTNHVFITNNALDPVPTWTNLQSNLPTFPVYSCLISADDPSVLIIGTEYGVYITDQGYSSSPNWVPARTDVDGNPVPASPVLDMEQVAAKPWTGHTLYAGTCGMGVWRSSSMLTGIQEKEEVKHSSVTAYPNPAHNSTTLRTSIQGTYQLNVYNIQGQRVLNQTGVSNGRIQLSTSELQSGNYFVELIGGSNKAISKIVVQH